MTSITEALRPAVVHPVGRYLGAVHDPAEPGMHWVRFGGEVAVLSEPELRTWVLARKLPDRPPGLPVTRQELIVAVGRSSGDSGLVDRLLDRGLLTLVAMGASGAEEFARRSALVLLVPGLGNTAGQPTVFWLGLPDRPLASVSRTVFELLVRGRLHRNLWNACTASAQTAAALGSTATADLDPAQILAQVLEALPVLLTTDAAALDSRPPA